jgi:SAM-dependent methyltransferase
MANDFWDSRYRNPDYAYGINPNQYFKHFIDHHSPGKLLLPGEGEGRNAVYAALKGWEVTAVDQSTEGKRKAMALAEKNQVSFTYLINNLANDPDTDSYRDQQFDAIALIYVQFPPEIRLHVHKMLVKHLLPGGSLLMEAFSKGQLGRPSGGPQAIELLYDRILLIQDFQQLNILELYEKEEWLEEGPYHQGRAAVIRLLGRKK